LLSVFWNLSYFADETLDSEWFLNMIDIIFNNKSGASFMRQLFRSWSFFLFRKQVIHISMQGQYFIIEGVAVDFLPVYNKLTLEALENAADLLYDRMKVKVPRAEYLIALSLDTGRKKDLVRIDLLLEQAKIDKHLLMNIVKRHNLYTKWLHYVEIK